MDFFGQRSKARSAPRKKPAVVTTTTMKRKAAPSMPRAPTVKRHNALPEATQQRIQREHQAAAAEAAPQSSTSPHPKKRAKRAPSSDASSSRTKLGDEDADDADLDRIAQGGRSTRSVFQYNVTRDILPDESYSPLSEDVRARASRSISSRALVEASSCRYEPYFDGLDDHPVAVLEYPAWNASEEFLLLVPVESDEYDPISDLLCSVGAMAANYIPLEMHDEFGTLESLETSSNAGMPLSKVFSGAVSKFEPSHASGHFDKDSLPPMEKETILRAFTKARNRRNGPLFLRTLERFNGKLRVLKQRGAIAAQLQSLGQSHGVPEHVWRTIQDQVYARVVSPHVGKLKQYEAFSDNVYGEMLPSFLSEIAHIAQLGPSSVFVDLGSGIGNLLIQASLQTGCEAYGCEYMPIPSKLAEQQIIEASHRWHMWHVRGGPRVESWHGDFTELDRVGQVLRRADVVLVNKCVSYDLPAAMRSVPKRTKHSHCSSST